jgi:hypothetical protein
MGGPQHRWYGGASGDHADRRPRRIAPQLPAFPGREPPALRPRRHAGRNRRARSGRRGALRRARLRRVIASAEEAVNVWDFESAIRKSLNAGHYAYIAQGSDDHGTIAANRAAFQKIGLRPRRLVDVGTVDLSVEVFGQRLSSPIMLCPVGAQLMFHPEGEVAVARAAKSKNALQILSTVTNLSVEDVAAARGGPGWFQLYTTSDWPSTERMLKRAEDAGCTALAWTVDIRRETSEALGVSIAPRTPSRRTTQACRRSVRCGACSTAST